jgi:hypothetical protein
MVVPPGAAEGVLHKVRLVRPVLRQGVPAEAAAAALGAHHKEVGLDGGRSEVVRPAIRQVGLAEAGEAPAAGIPPVKGGTQAPVSLFEPPALRAAGEKARSAR